MRRGFTVTTLCLTVAATALAQEMRIPASISAGDTTSIATTGSGKATFYLSGPGTSQKSDVTLGEEIHLTSQELKYAGEYLAVLCASSCQSSPFYVSAGQPSSLAFLVHPSRVPVSASDAVSGVAFPFDRFHNLVLVPVAITFQLTSKNAPLLSKSVTTRDGAAWFRTGSSKNAGPVQVVASLADVSAKRAVQQVASDPCNLRIKGEKTKTGISVETEPVHDCSGNIVSDGTVVTFTASDAHGKNTVDAPVKQGVAKAVIEADGPATISVASGVVLGNELRIGGSQ